MDADSLQELFEAIRAAAPAAEWSTGVALARDRKVLVETQEEDEITLRVLAGQRSRAPEVTLFPEDEDWQCDCGSRHSACAHIAAAIIALRQADAADASLPVREPDVARVAYRFFSVRDLLGFSRVLVTPRGERPFTATIPSWRDSDLRLVTTASDLAVERAVGTWGEGRVPPHAIAGLLQALQGVKDVTLDGAPITPRAAPILPVVRVQDAGRSFLVELVAARGVARRYRNGAAVTQGELRPIDDEAGLDQGLRRELQRGRAFDQSSMGQLLELLARLERVLPIDRQTRRLPRYADVAPRLVIQTDEDAGGLGVLPSIVYGEPPFARIDRGRLVLLGDGAEVPIRDDAMERRLTQRLQHQLGLEAGRRVRFDGEEAVSFAARLRDFDTADAGPAWHLEGDGHERFRLTAPLTGHVSLSAEGGVALSFDSEGRAADPKAVLTAWQKGWSLAPLDDGTWAPLPLDWMQRFGPALLGLLEAKALDADDSEPPAHAVADVVALAEALGAPVPPRFARLRALIDDFDRIPEAPLPPGVTAELRAYQRRGYEWLHFHREAGMGAMLADDMGLGKTLQALVSARGRTLVVAPTSVLPNWKREVEKFRPNLSVSVYHGPDRRLDPTADLTLTTWAILRLDIDTLSEIAWDTSILDESQTMKNPESQVAQAAYRLKSAFRIALTGTPLENRLEDLWSQMRYVEPGLLGDLQTFRERYVAPAQSGETPIVAPLRDRVRPFILRRLKREVAPDLPPRTELVERCELSAAERDLYEALRAATKREVLEALSAGKGVIQALEALLRLRQAACHSGLIPGQGEIATSAKVERLLELLDTLVSEGHKTLVFSQWTGLLDRVEPHLETARIDYLRLDGATRDRQAVVDGFQADDGPPVLLLSLKAGGTGLNLTAADHVILLDPWWNPAVEDQAADRAHRIGQTKPVMVHRFVAADTVEERILALQERKRALAASAVGEGGAASAGLTRDDLLELLGD